MCKAILTLCSALMLTACASGVPPMPARTPPPNLTAACPPLPQPKSGQSNELLANHVEVAELYHACRERHKGLSDWAGNTGE